MPVQAATFGQTNFNTAASATAYKSQIDSNSVATTRLADAFAPHQGSTPSMNVYLDPGFILSGTLLTEIGTYTTATFTNTSTSATVANASGISGTMWISGAGIAAGTTCTISGTTLTLSIATTAAGTSVPVVIGQIATTETAPVSNSRIDRIVVNSSTGVASVITGTPGSSPAVPSLTAGVIPVAQVLLTSTSTVITNSMITDERAVGGGAGANDTEATVASATTTDLGATNVNAILISGTTTITGFGSNGKTTNPYYDVRFSGALILTYNSTSMVLPGKVNITTIAGDRARFQYMGSGNWQCVYYSRASGAPVIEGPTATIASATTTDLGTAGVTTVTISGTTTITALGSTATTDNPIYFLTFSGILLLTYNSSSLLIPGGASITTAANDTAIAQYLGSGNWQIVSYTKSAGTSAGGGYRALSSTDTVIGADNGKLLTVSGTCALALTAAASIGNFSCFVQNTATSGIQIITITPNGSDNLDGANSTLVILPGEVRELNCNASAWITEVVAPFVIHAVATASPTLPRTGYRGFAGNLTGSGASGGNGATDGGGGGGGGAYNVFQCMTSAKYNVNSMALTLTVGAAVTGQGSANTAGTAGNTSSVEDTTNSRYLAFAYGGGAGGGGSLGAGGGGGGIGGNSAGAPNANGTPNAGGTGNAATTTTAGAGGVGGAGAGGAAGGAAGQIGAGGGGGNSSTILGGYSYAGYGPEGGTFPVGGGGGGCSKASTGGAGGQSTMGGGGGGGASNTTGGAGGASTNGGSGGAGSSGSANGTAGSAPGGGGGGSVGNTSGGGAVGEINVWGIV